MIARNWRLKVAAGAMLCMGMALTPVHATTIAYGPGYSFVDGGNVSIDIAVSTSTKLLTELVLKLQGDFGQSGEFVEVFVEGISIGTVAPGLTSTGSFNTPTSLLGGTNFNLDPIISTATLALDVSSFVGDGLLSIVFDASPAVAAFSSSTQIGQGPFAGTNGFSIAVAGTVTTTVAEPGVLFLLLLGLGLAGVAGGQRRPHLRRLAVA